MNLLSEVLWGYHVLFLITAVGVKLSFSTSFFQIRHFFKWLKYSLFPCKEEKGKVSSFAALSTALAGSIGTGNIVGVSAAISIGGAGAVFWMWVAAFFGMMTVFAECALSVHFDDGESKGAFSYIKRIGKGKILPFVYGIGCTLSALTMGNMAQANSVSEGMHQLGVKPVFTAVIISFIAFFSSKGGIKLVSKITEKLVPLMTLLFLVSSMVLLFIKRENIPDALNEIINGAFSKEAVMGGGFYIALKTGISRSVFTNEAGLGSSAAAFCEVENKNPVKMGYLGIFQVFLDTSVMCMVTALCILSGACERSGELLLLSAFKNVFGDFGKVLISLCMVLFALATVIASGYYGMVGLSFISKNKLSFIYPLLSFTAAFIGSIWNIDKIFILSDIFNGLMAIPNTLSLAFFLPLVKEICSKEEKLGKNTRQNRKIRDIFLKI